MYKLFIALILFFSLSFSEKFTIALIPDTQMAIEGCHASNDTQFSWIARHKDSLNIKEVIHLGDITNHNTVVEWHNSSVAFKFIEKVNIPYNIAIGNHDGPNSYTRFNDTFPLSRMPQINGSFPQGTANNTYTYFSAGGIDWMVLALQVDAGSYPEVMLWANQVCVLHPKRRIIVATHAYLQTGGIKLQSGIKIWNELVNKHNNIFMVVCGHYTATECVSSKTSLGNSVIEMLIDMQYGIPCDYRNSVTRLLEINTFTDSINSTTYSVVGKKFLTDSKNKFSLKLNLQKTATSTPQIFNNKKVIVTTKYYNLLGKQILKQNNSGVYIKNKGSISIVYMTLNK